MDYNRMIHHDYDDEGPTGGALVWAEVFVFIAAVIFIGWML